ncbi:hypothetical protein ABPG72_007051 [Tetrahymena utriculariae]
MIARSLFQTNKYFASKIKLLAFRSNTFAIPSPPSKPATELAIFQQLLRNKKKEIGLKQKDIKKDEKLVSQLKEQAKIERENNLKNYEASLKEYEEKFALPKRPANPFILYFTEKYVKSSEKVTESTKKLNQEFNQLTEQQLKIYKEKAAQDRNRYNEECEKFVKQNFNHILPPLQSLSSFQFFVSEQFAQDSKQKLANISSAWKQLSDEQKKQYEEKVSKFNAEQKQRLADFQKENNISDEDLKSLFQRKRRSKSVEQKESKSQ